jgi:hypothetical protein
MARVTRADLLSQDPGEGVAVIEALAPLATGVNEDGTAFQLPTIEQADSVATGNITANNQAVTLAVPQGMYSASFSITGTYVATANFEMSLDSGTTWFALACARSDVAAGSIAISTGTGGVWEAALPAGTTHVRLRGSGFGSGTLVARVACAVAAYEPAISANVLSVPANQSIVASTRSSNGSNVYRNINTGAGANVKGSSCNLYAFQATNLAASARFVKLYNKGSAPTVGTDTPLLTVAIPAGQSVSLSSADLGATFTLGLGIAATQAIADADTTLAAANEVVTNIFYA